MSTLESRCLDSFPLWLNSLAEDARALGSLLEADTSEAVRRSVAVGLTYLFKSLDLIDDGLEDLGFVDDAFVLRVAAARLEEGERGRDETGILSRLAHEAELIREFLGPDYVRLEAYVGSLEDVSARGRSVADVVTDESARQSLASEVKQWAEAHAAPGFFRDEKNLVKLRAFLATKLAAVTPG